MDYVIFDLEWNQCPYGKGKENPKLPFEIIEIGAVKMRSACPSCGRIPKEGEKFCTRCGSKLQ